GLRLPRALAGQIGVCEGQKVTLTADGARLIVQPVADCSLASLLTNMTPETMHDAFDWGEDVSGEVVED
ncbi:MAG: hypothetical protein ABI056_05285, partial [Caulobacteraceae bacterium]